MRFSIFLFIFIEAYAASASQGTLMTRNPWMAGYSVKLEAEIETQRDKKRGYVDGYESEFEIQVRKKLSRQLSLVVGAEIEGEQEDNDAAYYGLKQSIFGIRYKYKWHSWTFKNQGTLHYYTDHEYRKDKGIDGAIRLRVRAKKVFHRFFEVRFRTRYFNYFQTTGDPGTRQRRLRFETRPYLRLKPVRVGLLARASHEKEVGEDRNFFEFGPIVRWDLTNEMNFIFRADFRPWDSKVGRVNLFETIPNYQLEFQILI